LYYAAVAGAAAGMAAEEVVEGAVQDGRDWPLQKIIVTLP
jgi:hypothetical protein